MYMPVDALASSLATNLDMQSNLFPTFIPKWPAGCSTASINAYQSAWWRHQMETFSALLAICAGNSPVPGEFPTQRPVTRSFDVYFDLRPNKRLSKQSWGGWFETLSWSLWRHCNGRWQLCGIYHSNSEGRLCTRLWNHKRPPCPLSYEVS